MLLAHYPTHVGNVVEKSHISPTTSNPQYPYKLIPLQSELLPQRQGAAGYVEILTLS